MVVFLEGYLVETVVIVETVVNFYSLSLYSYYYLTTVAAEETKNVKKGLNLAKIKLFFLWAKCENFWESVAKLKLLD